MNDIGNMREAEPQDFVEAWNAFMRNAFPKDQARALMADHPPPAGMIDPIYVTPEGGEYVWARASNITNLLAMRAIKSYLYDRAITLPAEVSAAWAHIMERGQWAQEVRQATEELLGRYQEASDLVGAEDLMLRVIRGLEDRVLRGD